MAPSRKGPVAGGLSNRYLQSALGGPSGSGGISSMLRSFSSLAAIEDTFPSSERTTALQERLEELLVFEIKKDGGQGYRHLSVRGLYKHVLACITQKHPNHGDSTSPSNSGSGQLEEPTEDVGVDQDAQSKATEARQEHDSASGASSKRVRFGSLDRTQKAKSETDDGASKEEAELDAEKSEVTYRERLGGYVHPRDMRRLVLPFSASNEPELIVRRHAILLNFDPLRAIILRDRLLVLVPKGADSLLISLEQRVRGGAAAVESSIFGDPGDSGPESDKQMSASSHRTSFAASVINAVWSAAGKNAAPPVIEDETKPNPQIEEQDSRVTDSTADDFDYKNEWEEINAQSWTSLPFELQCLDAVLHVVCSILTDDATELQQAAMVCIRSVLGGKGHFAYDPLFVIRHIKDALVEMKSRVKGFVESMNRILDDEVDMALMNLSRLVTHPERFIKPVSLKILQEESDEPELILEAHLQIGLSLNNKLNLIQGQLDTSSELLDQKLDAVRNRILLANMILTVFSVCVASASFVGSLLGMNVPIPLEGDERAFNVIAATTVSGGFLLGTVIMVVLSKTGAIPGFLGPADDW